MRKAVFTSIVALIGSLFLATSAGAASIGIYSDNVSAANEAASIANSLGHTAVVLGDLSAGSIGGQDVVWALNSNNFSQLPQLTLNGADVANFVNLGGVFVYHDREVDLAETVLPGGGGFNIIRDFAAGTDINVLDGSTTLTNGPGGLIDDSTLDGGNFSSHGFTVSGSIPGGSSLILTRTAAGEIVDFTYDFGAGSVHYSTIPLDFYLGGTNNFADIYAPNVVAYAAELSNPIPEPSAGVLSAVVVLLIGAQTRRRR